MSSGKAWNQVSQWNLLVDVHEHWVVLPDVGLDPVVADPPFRSGCSLLHDAAQVGDNPIDDGN